MQIKLEATKQKKILKASVLKSPHLSRDRDLLQKIPNRKPMYSLDEDGDMVFTHWEVPGDQIEDFLIRWDRSKIEANSEATEMIMEYLTANTAIDDLPKYGGEIFPSKDGKIPKSYQEHYIRVDHRKKALLCSFYQGLGKSMSTLLRAKTKGYKKLLIIAPKRVVPNWKTNIRNTFNEDCLVYGGTKSQRSKQLKKIKRASIVVTNYEQVREINQLDIEFDEVIIDEIHSLSSPRTSIYKSCYHLLNVKNPKAHRQGLSGTPIRLRVEDLYHVLKLLDPDFAGRKSAFVSRYTKVVSKQRIRKVDKSGREYFFLKPVKVSSKNEDLLRKKLDCILIRVRRDGVVDFEDTIDIINIPLTAKQDKLYEQVLDEVLKEIKNLNNPLTKMLRLLQVSEGSYTLFPETLDSGKMDYIVEELKQQTEKAVIWFRFKPGSTLLHEKFRERSVLYNGDVSDNMKKLAVYSFQGVTNDEDLAEFVKLKAAYESRNGIWSFEPGEAQFFIGTYSQRSGLGIDLQSAALSYFMSFDFSPVSLVQAKDRIVRLNQTRDCVTKFLVSERTIEPQSLQSILGKLHSQYSILDGKYSDEAVFTGELINILHSHRRS